MGIARAGHKTGQYGRWPLPQSEDFEAAVESEWIENWEQW